MTLQAIDHVLAAIPAGGEEQALACYGALLGLPETPKPTDIGPRGGCWFATGAIRLHLGADTPFIPARKAHITFRVDDVGALTSRARAAECTVVDNKALPCRERVFIFDPFGKRLEFPKPLSGESENS